MLISLCISSFSFLAQSQEKTSVNALELLNEMNKYSDNPVNSVYTNQIGCSNIAQITSSQTVDDGQSIIKVCQFGGSNTATVDQVGNQQTSSVFQLGCGNEAIVESVGQSIYSVVKQVGCENYVKKDINNNDAESDKMISTGQYGGHNRIEIESMQSSSKVNVVQMGHNNTFKLEIDNNSEYNNFNVSQVGINANATINHSAFYTPMKTF